MKADSNFATLCPGVDMSEWCLSPPSNGTCCGICPSSGISGLGGHISLAFSSLSSIAAIALAPASAPGALVTNLIQADAYAVSLLGYLLSDSSGLDFFHAAYALLLALSSLIPLTAIAASPPWAVTGQKSPQERQAEAKSTIVAVLKQMGGESRSLRRRHRDLESHVDEILEREPDLVGDMLDDDSKGVPASHIMLYLGFTASVLLWGTSLYLGVLGGASGSTRVALSQPNCTARLGNAALYILYADIGFFILAIVVFIATIMNHLMHDVAKAIGRETTVEYGGSTKLVFGVSFIVWLVWMLSSFTIYFMAGNANLLASAEFSWSFGSTFSALMLIMPIYSVIKALWAQR
ncbi:hypothetical protein JCM8097_007891 [Rhodosporidiobolus ruineniae]